MYDEVPMLTDTELGLARPLAFIPIPMLVLTLTLPAATTLAAPDKLWY